MSGFQEKKVKKSYTLTTLLPGTAECHTVETAAAYVKY